MKKLLIPIIVGGLLASGGALAVNITHESVNVCHKTNSEHNPYEAIQVDENGYLNGHPNDFLYLGPLSENGHPAKDADDWCKDNVPVPPTPPAPVPAPVPVPTSAPVPVQITSTPAVTVLPVTGAE